MLIKQFLKVLRMAKWYSGLITVGLVGGMIMTNTDLGTSGRGDKYFFKKFTRLFGSFIFFSALSIVLTVVYEYFYFRYKNASEIENENQNQNQNEDQSPENIELVARPELPPRNDYNLSNDYNLPEIID